MTLKVIHGLQSFSDAICGTFVQHFTLFQLTVCLCGPSALTELLVLIGRLQTIEQFMLETRKVDKNKIRKALCVNLRPVDV